MSIKNSRITKMVDMLRTHHFVNIRFCLVVSLLCLIWVTISYFNQRQIIIKQKQTIDSLSYQVDSLNSELFNETNYSGRLILGLEYLKEINSDTHKKVDDYINHETE